MDNLFNVSVQSTTMVQRLLILLLLLGIISPVISAVDECRGYHETFDVRVLDGNRRTVEGAIVTVKYDRGMTFGDKYFVTPPQETGPSGQIHYDFYNGGTDSRAIDCNIEINASAGNTSKRMVVVAGKHGPTIDLVLDDLFRLKFYVRDQYKAPLPNASVSVGNWTGETDKNGLFFKPAKRGVYSYFASFMDASQAGSLNVSNDTEFEVVFPHYRISMDVTDDTGTPLPATLTIFGKEFELGDGGHFENELTFGERVPYKVSYKGLVKEGDILPATKPVIFLRYDVHAPLFGAITPAANIDRYRLNIDVSDPNDYAEGLDVSTMKVYYKIEPSDATTPWNNAIVFTAGKGKFTADFPELPDKSVIKFRAEIKDKAGNRAEKEGQFSTYEVAPPQNDTQNDTNTPPPPSEEQGIPLIYIIGGVFLLILGIYLVFRMKTRTAGGS